MKCATACALLAACGDNLAGSPPRAVPQVAGDWWNISGVPDLGALNAPGQQPVDFTIWQAPDAMWHLWSCIRFTGVGGNSRLFYHWQSPSLTASDWEPTGIAMEADPSVGEIAGGLQAPFVFRDGATFHLFYGAWQAICSATSTDGVTFTRVLDAHGQCPLFDEGQGENTRDPMVVRAGDHWQVVYTAFAPDGGAVYARTSDDLVHWSGSRRIAYGGVAGVGGSAGESPFITDRGELGYFLFRTHAYGADAATEVYQSSDPEDFGIDTDRFHVASLPIASPELIDAGGESFIAAFKPDTDGIRISHLTWVPEP